MNPAADGPAAQPRPLRIWQAVGLCLVLVAIQVVCGLAFAERLGAMSADLQAASTFLLSLISMVAILYLAGRRSQYLHLAVAPAGLARIERRLVGPILVLALGFAMTNTMIGNNLDSNVELFHQLDERLAEVFDANPLILLLFAVILNPFFEEVFFRGLILGGLRRRHGQPLVIILVAVLFAAVHVNPTQMVCVFLFSLFLNWLMLATANLWYTIICHASYNLLVMVYAAVCLTWLPEGGWEIINVRGWRLDTIDALGLAVLGGGAWLLVSRFRRAGGGTGEGAGGFMPPG